MLFLAIVAIAIASWSLVSKLHHGSLRTLPASVLTVTR